MTARISTIIRFKSGNINIAATVRETAKLLGYDEVSSEDLALDLILQGIEIHPHMSTKTSTPKNELGLNQIVNALQSDFYHLGNGWYANSTETVQEYWDGKR